MTGLLRLEVAGAVRARWFAVSLALAAGLVLFFVVLASRESAVTAFTGLGRVVTGTGLAALLFLPLLGVLSTCQAVPQARQQGLLEWYLSHPISRASCFWSMFLARLLAVTAPVAAVVVALGLAAGWMGQPIPLALLLRFLEILLAQGLCFAALGMLVSVVSRSPEQALLSGLGIWMAAVAVVDFALIGMMLRWRLPPEVVFVLGGFNPIQAARLGLLVGEDPDLGLLGPVGTWIAVNLGYGGTLAYALAWPAVLGGGALVLARSLFLRHDVS